MRTKTVNSKRLSSVLGVTTACGLAMLMLCFNSCRRLDETGRLDGEVGEMEFTASLSDATSKAVSDVDFAAYGISIGGYHTEGKIADAIVADKSQVYPNVFDYDPSDGQLPVPLVKEQTIEGVKKYILKTVKWTLDDVSYLSYFAWGQNKVTDAVSGIVNATKDVNDKGFPWLDIVNENDITKQIDITGARYLDQPNDKVVSSIDLNFNHLLSKLTFKVKSSVGATVTFTKMNVLYGKVFSKARFTFNSDTAKDSLGNFTAYNTPQSGSYSLGTPKVTDGIEILVNDMVVIPQKVEKGFVKVELAYTITSGASSIAQTKTVELPAGELLQGKNHVYTLDIKADGVTVNSSMVADWILSPMAGMPIVPGPRGDVLLLLDGYDKPYQHTDGKWYWLDRSGYNRHAELVGYYNGMHSTVGHYYSFTNSNNVYAKVPAFPSVTALHTDVIAQQNPPGLRSGQVLLDFHQTTNLDQPNDRRFWTHMGNLSTGTLYFDCSSTYINGQGRLSYTPAEGQARYDSKIMWSLFKVDGGAQRIYENASLKAEVATSGSSSLGVLETNLIGRNYGGYVSYVKVTAKERPIETIIRDYKMYVRKFDLQDNEITINPPVSDKLAIWLDGYMKPRTIDGKLVWKDNGTTQNHAQIMNDNISWINDGSYQFKNGGYMQLIKSLTETGVMGNSYSPITIEIVFVPDNGPVTPSEGLLRICNDLNAYPSEMIWKGNHYGSGFMAYSEYGNNTRYRVIPTNIPEAGVACSYVWTHEGGTNAVTLNGVKTTAKGGSSGGHTWVILGYAFPPGSSNAMTRDYFSGKIKALRIHSRVLTDAEIKKNYEFDKDYYGL